MAHSHTSRSLNPIPGNWFRQLEIDRPRRKCNICAPGDWNPQVWSDTETMSCQLLALEPTFRDIAKLVTLVFGCLVILGGLMGYVIAKSVPSLIMGGLFGLALIGVWAAGQQGWKLEPEAAAALAGVLFL